METDTHILDAYLDAVIAKNQELNLTTITDGTQARVLHLEDSLLGLPEVNAAPAGKLVDLGSGGGFPGVPLAVATGRQTLLVDSRAKKVNAVLSITESLDIANVEGYAGRIEELALEHPEEFAVATARALTALPSLLELAAPLLMPGGWLVAYKSDIASTDEEEFSSAQLLRTKLGMSLYSWRKTYLGEENVPREIIVFKKTGNPTVSLPRRPGMAQKRPYA